MADGRKGIADLVGDGGRQTAHRRQLELLGLVLDALQVLQQHHTVQQRTAALPVVAPRIVRSLIKLIGRNVAAGQHPDPQPHGAFTATDLQVRYAFGRLQDLAQRLQCLGIGLGEGNAHGQVQQTPGLWVHVAWHAPRIEDDHALVQLGHHQRMDGALVAEIFAAPDGQSLLHGQAPCQAADHQRREEQRGTDEGGDHQLVADGRGAHVATLQKAQHGLAQQHHRGRSRHRQRRQGGRQDGHARHRGDHQRPQATAAVAGVDDQPQHQHVHGDLRKQLKREAPTDATHRDGAQHRKAHVEGGQADEERSLERMRRRGVWPQHRNVDEQQQRNDETPVGQVAQRGPEGAGLLQGQLIRVRRQPIR